MTVCIIGENLSSLALAKALVKIGLEVDLIENKKINTYPKSRTIGISKSNIEFFAQRFAISKNCVGKLKI